MEEWTTEVEVSPVTVLVNGESYASYAVDDFDTIEGLVTEVAESKGIKRFFVKLNGAELTKAHKLDALTPGSTIELIAKDSRG